MINSIDGPILICADIEMMLLLTYSCDICFLAICWGFDAIRIFPVT